MKSQRKIAESSGVDRKTVNKLAKKTGKTGLALEKEVLKVAAEKKKAAKLVETSKDKLKLVSENSSNKQITNIEGSTFFEKLYHAKNDYDFNLQLIDKLKSELGCMETLMQDNRNGTISTVPQLKEIRELQKLNITLRNQIEEFEEKLGYGSGVGQDSDPFAI